MSLIGSNCHNYQTNGHGLVNVSACVRSGSWATLHVQGRGYVCRFHETIFSGLIGGLLSKGREYRVDIYILGKAKKNMTIRDLFKCGFTFDILGL